MTHKADVVVVPLDADHVSEARRAYRRFGKGHHAAGLNLGDAFAYPLARTSGEPLLFKGDGFAKTDIGLDYAKIGPSRIKEARASNASASFAP